MESHNVAAAHLSPEDIDADLANQRKEVIAPPIRSSMATDIDDLMDSLNDVYPSVYRYIHPPTPRNVMSDILDQTTELTERHSETQDTIVELRNMVSDLTDEVQQVRSILTEILSILQPE
jgi:hypothetical protein